MARIDSTASVETLVRDAAEGRDDEFDFGGFEEDFDDHDHDEYYLSGCHSHYPAIVPLRGCLAGDPHGRRTVALLGDSKAAQWFYALDAAVAERGWRLASYTKAGCPPLPLLRFHYPRTPDGVFPECEEWQRLLLWRLREEPPHTAVLSYHHEGYVHRTGRALLDAEWQDSLRGIVLQLRTLGVQQAVLLLDTPLPEFDIPDCLRHCGRDFRRCAVPRHRALDMQTRTALAEEAAALSVPVIDPADWFCTPGAATVPEGGAFDATAAAGGVCPAVVGGIMVYRDGRHVSTRYTRLLARSLADALPRA